MGQGNAKAALFVSNNEKGDAVMVKWLYSDVYHPTGFDVYRSAGKDDWVKISSAPVTLNKNADDSKYDDETKQLYQAITKTPYDEFSTSIARAFVLIKAIYNNQFANEVGIFYEDKTAKIGQTYKYKITKHNESKVTAESEEITCGVFDEAFEPQEVIFERNKKFIALSWKPDVYKYYGVDIYRKEIGAGDFTKLTSVGPITIDIRTQKNYKKSDVFYSDTTVNNEKGYIYKLVSINYFGQESRFTEEFTVAVKDFIPPTSPHSFKVRAFSVEGFARLTWDAIEEADLNGFNIYTSQDPEATFTKLNTQLLSKETKMFDAKNLQVGGHYFVVSSVDIAGNETPSGMMFGEVRDIEPPIAPRNLESKPESGKITLTWTANTEGDLMGYYIQKSLSDSNNLDNHYVILNSEICTDNRYEVIIPKNVKNEFVYRVVAVDTLYNISKPSINSLAQMPDVIPPKKPVLSNVGISKDTSTILVSWIANADADLAGYKLFRRLFNDSIFTQVNYSLIPKDVNEYKDRSAEMGRQYVYAVKAVDNSKNESDLSNEFNYTLKKKTSNSTITVTKYEYSSRKKEVLIQWKWQGEQELKGYVVYMMSDDGILKPFTGLSESNELRTKQVLDAKKTFEIRAYTLKGEIIKSKLFVVDARKI